LGFLQKTWFGTTYTKQLPPPAKQGAGIPRSFFKTLRSSPVIHQRILSKVAKCIEKPLFASFREKVPALLREALELVGHLRFTRVFPQHPAPLHEDSPYAFKVFVCECIGKF
jgi:hypothetical protein